MRLKERIKHLLTRKKIDPVKENLRAFNAYLIAMARLGFIKPKDLIREAKNTRANADYLLKMIEEGKK